MIDSFILYRVFGSRMCEKEMIKDKSDIVKFNLENNGDENIGLFITSSKLEVNDGSQWLLNEGMLLDYGNDDTIEPGESGEFLQVYTLEKEQYDKIWKDKPFEIEFGPIKNDDTKDISKGKKASFTLPE